METMGSKIQQNLHRTSKDQRLSRLRHRISIRVCLLCLQSKIPSALQEQEGREDPVLDLQRCNRTFREQKGQRRKFRHGVGAGEGGSRIPQICATQVQECKATGYDAQGSNAVAVIRI